MYKIKCWIPVKVALKDDTWYETIEEAEENLDKLEGESENIYRIIETDQD